MRRYDEYGYLSSSDLDMLTRVLDAMTPADATYEERHARAATIVTLFQSGLDTEEKLIAELMGRAE
ncbi:MAG: hypothetical protein M9955_19835 [Rhizobiaceae bacterium]|nr:hypothetical protein [Rhizobiaceae bacterium]